MKNEYHHDIKINAARRRKNSRMARETKKKQLNNEPADTWPRWRRGRSLLFRGPLETKIETGPRQVFVNQRIKTPIRYDLDRIIGGYRHQWDEKKNVFFSSKSNQFYWARIAPGSRLLYDATRRWNELTRRHEPKPDRSHRFSATPICWSFVARWLRS